MFKRYYHCFIAGLYDLGFDDGKNIATLTDFREELKEILHPDDLDLTSIIFLPYDNSNLIRYMAGKRDEMDVLGNYTAEDFDDQIERLGSIIKVEDLLPEYMVAVISDWLAAEKSIDLLEAEKTLIHGYYTLAAKSGNRFLKRWTAYELDLNNILVLKNSMEMSLDASQQIIGTNELAEELKIISRRKSDFRVPPEPDYATELFNIAGESEFLDREIKLDIAKWNYINDLIFFEYFTIDFILGYMVKLGIALRWKGLDQDTGERMLKRLVAELKEGNGRKKDEGEVA
jgi:hypothetical protein